MSKLKSELVVTTYRDPDTDGFACAIAYAEYLNRIGKPAVAKLFGQLHRESLYVLKSLRQKHINKPISEFSRRKIILVDASETKGLDSSVASKKVMEIIDHRLVNEAGKFINADIQIEPVGAAATLIAEKFYQAHQPISRLAAGLLYAGIISNTLNLKARVTTIRDRKMVRWLSAQTKIPNNLVSGMFLVKSDLIGDKLEKQIIHDLAWFNIGKKMIGIAQLEIVGARNLIKIRMDDIDHIMARIKRRYHMDHIFLSIIDLREGNNTFVCFDSDYRLILEKTLRIKFKHNIANRSGLIMRKEIVPRLVANEASR
jgi:manganese-dependent inorganic pyrophosphatase